MSKSAERDAYARLKDLIIEIPVGTSSSEIPCPFCDGGRNKDNGFVVTRTSEAEALYCCHRATCGKSGRIAAWGFRLEQDFSNSPASQPNKKFTPKLYTGDTTKLGGSWLSEISILYNITSEELDWANWCEDIKSNRLVVPIFSSTGVRRGIELRRSKLAKDDYGPKTYHYREIDEVWLGWFRRSSTGPIILVEDVISALKVSRHFQAASLMGSHLKLDHILEIQEVAGDNPVFLCLDRDATDKAVKFISNWRFVAPNFRAIPLSKDLKYLTDDEIIELIK